VVPDGDAFGLTRVKPAVGYIVINEVGQLGIAESENYIRIENLNRHRVRSRPGTAKRWSNFETDCACTVAESLNQPLS